MREVGSGVMDGSVCDVVVAFPPEHVGRGWLLLRSIERLGRRKSGEVSMSEPVVRAESAIVVPAFAIRAFVIPHRAVRTGHHGVPAGALR